MTLITTNQFREIFSDIIAKEQDNQRKRESIKFALIKFQTVFTDNSSRGCKAKNRLSRKFLAYPFKTLSRNSGGTRTLGWEPLN